MFRENVFHTGRLEQCANAAAGDQPCSGRRGFQKNFSRPKFSDDLVWNRPVDNRNCNDVLLRVVNSFRNRIGDFVCFAETDADKRAFLYVDSVCLSGDF